MVLGRKKKKPLQIKGVVIEDGIRTEYDIGPDIDHLKEFVHGGYKFKPDKANVYTQYKLFGRVKRKAVYFDFINKPADINAFITPRVAKPFDPVKMWSAEKAKVQLHTNVIEDGTRNLVSKLPGGGFQGNKKLMFIIMFIAVLAIVGTKLMGVW